MQVKAASGLRCPKEGKPREYIEDKEFVEVPDTQYYRRLVRDTSLVTPPDKPATPEPAAKNTRKQSGEEA